MSLLHYALCYGCLCVHARAPASIILLCLFRWPALQKHACLSHCLSGCGVHGAEAPWAEVVARHSLLIHSFMVRTMKGCIWLFLLYCMPTEGLGGACLRNITAPSFFEISAHIRGGLSDRMMVFKGPGSLAGYLGAQLIPDPPVEMLTANHNHGKPVDAHLEWSHYLNFTFRDGTLVLNSTCAATRVKGIQTVSSFKEALDLHFAGKPFLSKYKDLYYTSVGHLQNQIDAIVNITSGPPCVLSELSKLSTLSNLSKGCTDEYCEYVQRVFSRFIKRIATTFSTVFGVLHDSLSHFSLQVRLRDNDNHKCKFRVDDVQRFAQNVLDRLTCIKAPMFFFTNDPAKDSALQSALSTIWPQLVIDEAEFLGLYALLLDAAVTIM